MCQSAENLQSLTGLLMIYVPLKKKQILPAMWNSMKPSKTNGSRQLAEKSIQHHAPTMPFPRIEDTKTNRSAFFLEKYDNEHIKDVREL